MKDVKQSNIFGDNQLNSKKIISVAKNHRFQGFIIGVISSLVATAIWQYFKG